MLNTVDRIGNNLINEYFMRELNDGRNLLTTRHGSWCILTDNELSNLRRKELTPELKRKLVDKEIIITEENKKDIQQAIRKRYSGLRQPCSFWVISVTNRCNFNCAYCHVASGGPDSEDSDLDKETADKILNFIFNYPNQGNRIIIEGGEPLLNLDIVKYIYKKAKRLSEEQNKRFDFSFTTNLGAMTEETARELTDMDIDLICASLDGPKQAHNSQRQEFEKVVNWGQRLRRDYDVKVHYLPVITKKTLENCTAQDFVDEFIKQDERMLFFKIYRPTGRGTNKELRYTPQEYFKFWKEGVEYILNLNKQGKRVKERSSLNLVSSILNCGRISMCYRRPCGAGSSILSFSSDGTIVACDALRSLKDMFSLGNVYEDQPSNVIKRAANLAAFPPDVTPECSTCPYLAYCSICYGNVVGEGNDLCTKAPTSDVCQIRKMQFDYLFQKLAEDQEDAAILRRWAESRQKEMR